MDMGSFWHYETDTHVFSSIYGVGFQQKHPAQW